MRHEGRSRQRAAPLGMEGVEAGLCGMRVWARNLVTYCGWDVIGAAIRKGLDRSITSCNVRKKAEFLQKVTKEAKGEEKVSAMMRRMRAGIWWLL